MNRLIIIFIILLSCVFIQGTLVFAKYNNESVSYSDTSFSSWKEDLAISHGIPEPAIHIALNTYFSLMDEGLLKNDSIVSIIDFSKPSTEKRLFILDLKNQKILKKTFVAHGMLSGVNIAESFSNKRHSNKSSLGLYVTGETYQGKHGYSLRLDGQSTEWNDNARKRAIVIHGAKYVSESFIEKNGRIGRSFGCPAIPVEESEEIINLIKDGSSLFIYHPTLIPISQSDLEKLP
ncbi:MAG: murein L,D-transpeptidase catalytic domain family protein [Bacteroidales bacterium]|nr:murein L,D-transpeptidase catalytic domain family protein [Bacteroidales bacterium]